MQYIEQLRIVLFSGRWSHQFPKQFLQIPEGAKVIPAEHPRSRAVQQVVKTLAARVSDLEGVPEHLKNIEWNVTVVDSKIVNALAAPGGHVLVFTGAPAPGNRTAVIQNQ